MPLRDNLPFLRSGAREIVKAPQAFLVVLAITYGEIIRFRFDIDKLTNTWKIFQNGFQIYSGAHPAGELKNIRINFSDSTGVSNVAAVDNIKLWDCFRLPLSVSEAPLGFINLEVN